MSYRDFSGFLSHAVRLSILTILFTIISVVSVSARQVTLTWDPNSEPDLSHYIVYWGTVSGNYQQNSGDIGLATEYTVTIPDQGRYYFAVTAVDNAGLESDYSNEVCTEEGSGAEPELLPPVANAGPDQTKAEGQVVTLDGSASYDPDGSALAYLWTQTSGPTVTLSNSASAQPTFTAPNAGTSGATLTFSLKVTDSHGLQDTDYVVVNITWVNRAPTANAGADQIRASGQVVTLNGSASSDPDGSPLTYKWTQISGPAVTLSSSASAQPTFTAPEVGTSGATLTFSLKVIDPQGLQGTDTVAVKVTWVNRAPTANAGAGQTRASGQVVTLNGSASSDPDGSPLTYRWTQISGPAVTLSNSASAQTTFTAPVVGISGATLTFSLKVTDPQGLQGTATVAVKITWVNGAPTARAGADQTSAGGQVVTLNGSASSDPDGSPLTYRWTQTSGPAVKLRNTASVQTTFTAPEVTKSQSLVFKLTVKDPQGLKGTDTVVVNIMPANMAPIANAGPDQNVEEGEVVTLNGSNSIDPDGIIISYEWKQTSGNMVNLSSCTAAQPTFVAPYTNPEGEALTFELTVIDSQGLKSTDSCIINIIWVNDPPVADAGDDQNVEEGQMVTLCGMDSIDPDGAIAAWQWKQISGISVALSSYTIAEPTFTAPRVNQDGNTLVFELTVTDSHGLKSSDTCVVNVLWVNDPPVANAGSDQDTVSGKKVTLNGSASVDYDGFISSYLWTQVSGTPVTLSNPTAVKPTFTPGISSLGETLVFQLTVTDNGGLKSTSDCAVTVSKSVRAVTSSWNLVTIPKTTVKTTVNNALTPIMSNVISIWAYENNSWKVFDPSKPETSSTLNGLAPGRAVWVNMSQDAELAISAAVTVDPVILVPGWNLVGYNSSTSKNISGAISSISKNIKGVWTYADGKWKIFDPKNPGLSDLQVLEPGSGYWVYVDKRCSWTY